MRQCGALLIDLSAYLATVRGGLGATGHESSLLPLTFPAVAAVVAAAIYLWRCCCRGWCCWRSLLLPLAPARLLALAELISTSASAPALQGASSCCCRSSGSSSSQQQQQRSYGAVAGAVVVVGGGRGSEPNWLAGAPAPSARTGRARRAGRGAREAVERLFRGPAARLGHRLVW